MSYVSRIKPHTIVYLKSWGFWRWFIMGMLLGGLVREVFNL